MRAPLSSLCFMVCRADVPAVVYAAAANTLPKSNDPQWYYGFLLLFFLALTFIIVVLPGRLPFRGQPQAQGAQGGLTPQPATSFAPDRLVALENRIDDLVRGQGTSQLDIQRLVGEQLHLFREEIRQDLNRRDEDIKQYFTQCVRSIVKATGAAK